MIKSKFLKVLETALSEDGIAGTMDGSTTTQTTTPDQQANTTANAVKKAGQLTQQAKATKMAAVHSTFADDPNVAKALQSGDSNALAKALQTYNAAAIANPNLTVT